MRLVAILTIVAAPVAAHSGQETYPDAAPVYVVRFADAVDADFDAWPDGWRRQRGPGLPHYVSIRLGDHPSPVGGRSLEVELNGGEVAVYSPPLAIDPRFDYLLAGLVSTEGLVHDRAMLSLNFLNDQGQVVAQRESQPLGRSSPWTRLEVGPLAPPETELRQVAVGLHVRPGAGQDLTGRVYFDDLRLLRLPRVNWSTSRRLNVFNTGETIELTCRIHGDDLAGSRLTCELLDVFERVIARAATSLGQGATWGQRAAGPALGGSTGTGETGTSAEGLAPTEDQAPAAATAAAPQSPVDAAALPAAGGADSLPSGHLLGSLGEYRWLPPIRLPGYYRARVALETPHGGVHQRETRLVVWEPQPGPDRGPFGWSLPHGTGPLDADMMETLLISAGINWVKLPLWNAPVDDDDGDRLVETIERLEAHGIGIVGLLADPPEKLEADFGSQSDLGAAILLLSEPKVWYPSIEPLLARLSLQVRWWQIGGDRDLQLDGFRDVAGKLARVKSQMDLIGQDVKLALPANLLRPPPSSEAVPWRAVSLSAEPTLAAGELPEYLRRYQARGIERWLLVEPLDRRTYSLADRVCDLAQRMLEAKIHEAERVFLADPLAPDRGLLEPDGSPGELLLPWRSLAMALAEAEYLGQLKLPEPCPNRVFRRSGEVWMIAWSPQPAEQTLYLGGDIRHRDLWDAPIDPRDARTEAANRLVLGPLPSIVYGLDEAVARTRLSLTFSQSRLPSQPEVPQRQELRFTNHFSRAINGSVELKLPRAWRAEPARYQIDLAAGEEARLEFDITLNYDALIGRQPVRVDFEVMADRPYRFSAYDELELVSGDVEIELFGWLNGRGELEVHQHFISQARQPASFRCDLFAPGRRRMRSQIRWPAAGETTTIYRFRDGGELLGKPLQLRAVEIDGPRRLNYQLVVEP